MLAAGFDRLLGRHVHAEPRVQHVERRAPRIGHPCERGKPGPDVLTALAVMRRECGHRQRPVGLDALVVGVELADADAEPPRIAADVVQRQHLHETVRRGVLYALRRHRSRQLLEARRHLGGKIARHVEQQHGSDEAHERCGRRTAGRGPVGGNPDDGAVGLTCRRSCAYIASVHVELDEKGRDDGSDLGAGVIAMGPVPAAHVANAGHQPSDLRCEDLVQHLALGLMSDRGEGVLVSRIETLDATADGGEVAGCAPIDE